MICPNCKENNVRVLEHVDLGTFEEWVFCPDCGWKGTINEIGPEGEMVIDIENWQSDIVTIGLMLTRRCNFECEHCFFECGPHFRGYMGDKVLEAVYTQILQLLDLDVYPTINLIGGEPTLNLDKFAHILEYVSRWDVPIEMTTNGWWLHKPSTARKFFQVVKPYVGSDGVGLDGGFTVRISSDIFHDQFRPTWLQGDKLEQYLESLWEHDEDGVFYKEKLVCTGCGRGFHQMPDHDRCPECDDYVDYEGEEVMSPPPKPMQYDPWIYVQKHTGGKYVIPIGRGQGCGGSNDKGKAMKGYCNSGLTYLPNGKLMDICCSGSWCEFGDVWDHPIMLLELARMFVRKMKPSCWNCREDAKKWKRLNLKRSRIALQEEIDRCDEHDLWETNR